MKTVSKNAVNSNGNSLQTNRRAAAKKKKAIILSIVAAVLVVAVIITLVLVVKKVNEPTPTVSTSYKIDEVTVGNVNTTISGSGSLTPVRSETLTAVGLLEEIEDAEESGGSEGSEEAKESQDSAETEEDENVSLALEQGASVDSDNSQGGASDGTTPIIVPETAEVIVGGKIKSVSVKAGDTVAKGAVIAVIEFEDEEAEETETSEDAEAAEEADDAEAEEENNTRNIIAPYAAVILELYIKEGEEVSDKTEVAMLMGTGEGYAMNISVDETNISTVALGQEVEIDIESSKEEMPTGTVSDISYNGTTSGSSTSYRIEVSFAYVEGTYPGMSVSAEIVIEDSGDGLLVPVSAVNTSGDTKYVYLAPSDTSLGDVLDEESVDVSKLKKVTVTTGMSDGSYIMIESGDISEGELIVVVTRTSTATASESSEGEEGGRGGFGKGGRGDFGGFGGGSLPGGSMPEGFDPSNMPSDGFPGFGN